MRFGHVRSCQGGGQSGGCSYMRSRAHLFAQREHLHLNLLVRAVQMALEVVLGGDHAGQLLLHAAAYC